MTKRIYNDVTHPDGHRQFVSVEVRWVRDQKEYRAYATPEYRTATEPDSGAKCVLNDLASTHVSSDTRYNKKAHERVATQFFEGPAAQLLADHADSNRAERRARQYADFERRGKVPTREEVP